VEILEALSARTEQVEDEYALFFTQSLDLLCIAGFDGYFKHLNPIRTTSLGWTLEDLKAKPFLDFVHPDDRASTLAEVDRLAEGAELLCFENRYRHRDGSYLCLRWSARSVPVRQEIYATARDVTQLKRLEREVLEVVDREKEHLGRELHDGLCQTLAGIAQGESVLA
jgi:PAS domain S-box-containing protein